MGALKRNLKQELNNMAPATAHAKLGDIVDELIGNFNAVLTKLDADAGVTDTDFKAKFGIKTLSERA